MVRDLAIDVGTETTSLLQRGDHEVMSGPSVVARFVSTGEIVAVGEEAAQMVGRTPEAIETVRPFRGGKVVDLPAAQGLIRALLRQAGVGRRHRVRVVATAPTAATPLERRAIREAVEGAGVAEVRLLGRTMAAALGSRLPVDRPAGSLVVDTGAGATEAAVLSLGGVVALEFRLLGGHDLDRDIQMAIERRHGVIVDRGTAEQAKTRLAGTAAGREPGVTLTVRGRRVGSGAAVDVRLGGLEIDDAIDDSVRAIVDTATACVGWCPPEIAGDLASSQLHLVGGGSRLRGLAERIGAACRIPVSPAGPTGRSEEATGRPEEAVVRGAARCLGQARDLDDLFLDGPAPWL